MPFTFDLVWADPAEPTEEQQLFEQRKMFAENERGGNTVIFSRLALEEFFKKTGCSYIVRAHQRKDLGVEITKGAKVLTCFSSSHCTCFSPRLLPPFFSSSHVAQTVVATTALLLCSSRMTRSKS